VIVIITSSKMKSTKYYPENLPFLNQILPLRVTRESETCVWRSHVAAIIVTDWKLSITPLFVSFVNYANVTTSKNGTFVWVVGDCKLS